MVAKGYKFLVLTALFCTMAVTAVSQVSMEVTVIEKTDARPVSNVEVRAINPAIGQQIDQLTDRQGKARFHGLSTSGSYRLMIRETERYKSIETDPIDLKSGHTRSILLVLAPKDTLQLPEITVQAPVTRINTIDAEVSAELDSRELQQIPVEGRSLDQALHRLPNVTQATGFFPEAPPISINGANALYTNYLIDGLDNNEQFLGGPRFPVPIGLTKNVTVLANTYTAEYGLSGNGIFNVTTKSGSNRWDGEVFYVTRPGPIIDGDSEFAQRDLSGNQVKAGFQRHQAGFAVGGPVQRDQTFFFANVEHTLDLKDNQLRVPQLGINETVGGQNRFTYLSGKLDHHWNNRWRSSLRVNSSFVDIERQGGGLSGGVTFPSASNTQQRNALNMAGKTIYSQPGFSSETSLQYARFRWNYADPVNPDHSQVQVLGPSENTLAILGHPGYVFNELENTFQFRQKVTIYRGSHTLKAGASLISSDHQLTGGGNPNGNYLVKLNQQQLQTLRGRNIGKELRVDDIPSNADVLNYNVELRPRSFGKRQNIYSVFVEDMYSVSSRLNLTLGLRYDYDNLSRGGAERGDYNNLAPRFNFNYKLTSRSSVRGGYGLVYDKIVYSVYSDALQQSTTSEDFKKQLQALKDMGQLPQNTDLDRVTFNGNLTANFANVDYLEGPSPEEVQGTRENIFSNELRILNPNGYDNPYTHQFSVGYQRQMGDDKLFYVDLMHSRSYNLYRLRDLNAPTPYSIDPRLAETSDPKSLVRSREEADASRDVPIYSGPGGQVGLVDGDTLRGIGRSVIMTETKGESRFWAATFNLKKERGGDDFSYRLSYTLSSRRNNTEDINFRAENANNFAAEWGPSINDRRHVIEGQYTYYPLQGLTVTVAANIQSGQPINRVPDAEKWGTRDLNGDGRSFADAYVGNSDRVPGASRNSDRLPWANTFDVHVQYRVDVGPRSKLEFSADVFNVFDANNLSGYANNATQSNQIQAGPESSGVIRQKNAGPPRQFQFNLRYLF